MRSEIETNHFKLMHVYTCFACKRMGITVSIYSEHTLSAWEDILWKGHCAKWKANSGARKEKSNKHFSGATQVALLLCEP